MGRSSLGDKMDLIIFGGVRIGVIALGVRMRVIVDGVRMGVTIVWSQNRSSHCWQSEFG